MLLSTLSQRVEDLCIEFQRCFACPPQAVVRAPGRVGLIGGHVDFSEGFVMPAAVDRDILIAIAANTSKQITVFSVNFQEYSAFDFNQIELSSEHPWSNYVRGVVVELQKLGITVPGLTLAVQGTVPMGTGLSSSAAIEVATALAILEVMGDRMAPLDIARLCQRAENNFVGVRSGIMDQFASLMGEEGKALFLDCRNMVFDHVDIPNGIAIVVADSKKPRSLSKLAEYNKRRVEVETALATLRQYLPGIRALRDVSLEELAKYEDNLDRASRGRARHVVGEIARVQQAAEHLTDGRVEDFGLLLNASHASSRQHYESSCAELDWLQETAAGISGCLGSRLTGAGFGGCTVSLVWEDAVESFKQQLTAGFTEKAGYPPDIFVMATSNGAGRVR